MECADMVVKNVNMFKTFSIILVEISKFFHALYQILMTQNNCIK